MEHQEIISKYSHDRSNILAMLHALQDSNPRNYLTDDALKAVARHLKVNLSWVYGVAGYYSMFSLAPRGRFIIRVCSSPVCNMMGSEDIVEALCRILGIKPEETTPDGLFTLEEAECLGICDTAPAMMVNRTVYGNLTSEKIAVILDELKTGKNGRK